jgi:hypothetical protein
METPSKGVNWHSGKAFHERAAPGRFFAALKQDCWQLDFFLPSR